MARRASLALVALAALISCAVPGAWARPPDEEQLDIIEMVAEAEAELEQIADELETAAGEPELELELEPELPETVDEPPAPAPPAPPTPKAADAPAVALTFAENMLAGSAARLTASVLLHPFDTMRTRAQARKRAQPTGVRFGAVDIMLKGIVPQIALAMPAGAIQFAALDYAQKLLASPELAAKVPLNKSSRDLIASALGALAASVIRVPQEVLKQPVQAGLYPNSAASARAVLRAGPGRLYRGFGATVARDVPWNSLGYTFFRMLKLATRAPDTAKADMLLAGVGGAIAAVILTPMDVAKTRLMTQSASDAVQYSGVFSTIARVLKDEGVGALFRGVLPRTIYLAPLAALVYACYEEFKRLIIKFKADKAAAA